MKSFITLLSALLLTACSSIYKAPEISSRAGIEPSQFSDAKTIEEIRALKPQAKLPMKVVIVEYMLALSNSEREIIRNWEKKLIEIGFVSSMEVMPNSLRPNCHYKAKDDCFMQEIRKSSARMNADSMLFLTAQVETESYLNPLSILNVTIAGLWLAPGHHRESAAIFEASLFDINNGYLYGSTEGLGTGSSVRPYMYVEKKLSETEAREKALNNLLENIYQQAKAFMQKQAVAGK